MSGGGINTDLPDYMRKQDIKAADFKAVAQAREAAEHSLAFFRKMMVTKTAGCHVCQCPIPEWHLDGCLTKKEYPL